MLINLFVKKSLFKNCKDKTDLTFYLQNVHVKKIVIFNLSEWATAHKILDRTVPFHRLDYDTTL